MGLLKKFQVLDFFGLDVLNLYDLPQVTVETTKAERG